MNPIAVASMRMTRPKGPVRMPQMRTRLIATPVFSDELFRPERKGANPAHRIVSPYAQREAHAAMVRREKMGGVSNPENAVITPFLILPIAIKTAIPIIPLARVEAPIAAR